MIAKCECQSCDGKIEFDAADFEVSSENDIRRFGQTVPCPHCGMDTAIYLTKEIPAPIASPVAPQARLNEIRMSTIPPQKSIETAKAEELQNAIRDAEGRAIIRVFRLLFWLVVIAVIFWWIFLKPSQPIPTASENFSQPQTQTFPVNDASPPKTLPKVSISNENGEIQDSGGMDITGIIQNLSDAPLNGVTVNFSFFDDDGNKLDDAMDFINTLAPNETWSFKVSSLKDNCKKYRLDSITSYIDNSQENLDVEQTQ